MIKKTKLICPTNPEEHDKFLTETKVRQMWVVNGEGAYVSTFDECTTVLEKPERLVCMECDAEAVPAPLSKLEEWHRKRASQRKELVAIEYANHVPEEWLELFYAAFDSFTSLGAKIAEVQDGTLVMIKQRKK